MNEYDEGYQAYYDGESYHMTKPVAWRTGWQDAELEDRNYLEEDYNDEF